MSAPTAESFGTPYWGEHAGIDLFCAKLLADNIEAREREPQHPYDLYIRTGRCALQEAAFNIEVTPLAPGEQEILVTDATAFGLGPITITISREDSSYANPFAKNP